MLNDNNEPKNKTFFFLYGHTSKFSIYNTMHSNQICTTFSLVCVCDQIALLSKYFRSLLQFEFFYDVRINVCDVQ